MEAREVLDALEIELQVVVSCPAWLLGTVLWFSGRAARSFNH